MYEIPTWRAALVRDSQVLIKREGGAVTVQGFRSGPASCKCLRIGTSEHVNGILYTTHLEGRAIETDPNEDAQSQSPKVPAHWSLILVTPILP